MTKDARDTIYYKRSRFVTRLPVGLRYTEAHYWLEDRAGVWRIGLTKFATRMLGDLVEYDFNVRAGDRVGTGQTIGWMEGFKAVTDVYSVAEGDFVRVNPALAEDITLVETDPYAHGWLYEVRGEAEPANLDVHGYVSVLDATIDRLLLSRHEEGPR